MRKSKTAKKKASTKARKPATKATEPKATAEAKPRSKREELCVFAFRLTPEERADIHKAAGPAKASRVVRALAVAAARNDEAAVKAIMKALQSKA